MHGTICCAGAIAGKISGCRPATSALARNDPTLLAKNYQHHTGLVTLLPAGKSAFLPRGNYARAKAPMVRNGGCPGRPGPFFPKTNTLDTPSARMTEIR